jgi:hypothetical protein
MLVGLGLVAVPGDEFFAAIGSPFLTEGCAVSALASRLTDGTSGFDTAMDDGCAADLVGI